MVRQLSPALASNKLRGGYYTPARIAEFLAAWSIRDRNARVLEPSCGDGSIVEPAARRLGPRGHITAIELFPGEARRARARAGDGATVVTSDAFKWFWRSSSEGQFDAILGNPPFIRYQNFPEEHRKIAFAIMAQEGLHPSRLTNAWLPFVVAATRALRKGGRLALVLPAELLQVNYAAELRGYLARKYSRLTVVTFRRLVFEGIQQETVLLLGIRGNCAAASMSFVEMDTIQNLTIPCVDRTDAVKVALDHAREKWTQYYLSSRELTLIREIEKSHALTTLGEIARVDVGVVTGRNEFFVLSGQQAKKLGVLRWCLPLVGRSAQIPGLSLTAEDWRRLADEEGKCFLLQLGDVPRESLAKKALSYVEWGEMQGFHQGYKCRIRLPRWWSVPSVWVPDAFLLRQIYDGPRIVENRAQATCTDTIHRIKLTSEVSAASIAAASMNSLTFAFAEIRGRSYGGGVLELEPTEAEALPFPRIRKELPLDDLDLWARRKSVDQVLPEVDRLVLSPMGLSRSDVEALREIWRKLFDRRMNRRGRRSV